MNTVCLREFVTSIPTFVETGCVAELWRLFQQFGCEQVVIVDEGQQPIGLLSLSRLLLYLPLHPALNPPDSSEAASIAHPDSTNVDQSIRHLRQFALSQATPLLEPLIMLPAHWKVDQVQPYLLQIEHQQWVLVNLQGHCVGLVDRLHLLQFLMNRAQVQEKLHWQSLASLPNGRQPSLDPLAGLDPLIDLLERLPIPLMLQTAVGQIITQNLAWRQQVGELQDPNLVRREAASILETAVADRWYDGIVEAVDLGRFSHRQTPSPELHLSDPQWEDWNSSGSQISSDSYPENLCRLGTAPDTCICLCPMKSGQDRIWQFVKIPMGGVAHSLRDDRFSVAGIESDFSHQFKLATLSFSPDPEWRNLTQAESLWLVLAQDITEPQQVAKELAAKNADLVQLNRLKDEFLACISHELKTPLTAVLGLSSLLKDQALGELNDRQARYAQLIHQSGRHLILIVNNILDLTRIETGQLDLLPEPVSIEMVCSRAYGQARQLHTIEGSTANLDDETEVHFDLEIEPGLESLVADELRLRQMLTNLLSNAIKFTPDEGAIGLRVEAWEGWIAFTVWDQGIGIPADKQHLIFQKFQQLEHPLTRRYEGTGLGLVLTQRLARLHGGDVTFTSKEGVGSEFTLLLPPSPPQSSPNFRANSLGMTRQTSGTSSQNRLAIVVEATPQVVDSLTQELTHLGHRVAIARSGTEALEKVRRLQPGIVFLSPILPMLSGWDVLTLLKSDPETRHIPVVMTAMRVEKDLAYQNGANGFLSLPMQSEALERCLNRLVSSTLNPSESALPSLTVLHLHEGKNRSAFQAIDQPFAQDLASLLHLHQCRVLEVDDLEQADLLARVWKPNVVLLDNLLSDPVIYMQHLSQYPFLTALPIITLDVEVTQAANQIPELTVFPCLAETTSETRETSTPVLTDLLQVIRMAAGIHWQPCVTIVDFGQLEAKPTTAEFKPAHALQALSQYLQMAGYQSTVSSSWSEVWQQLEHQNLDMLLFCVHSFEPQAMLLTIAQQIEQLPAKPPILVWNPHPTHSRTNTGQMREFEAIWQTVATEILPPAIPMPELLDRVEQLLQNR
ncbi:MAG TPA: hybrid sensor histidine kinase/response regulator [Trichocoleus sp.]|jgi:signal transduction histidine kinase/CheY-like chemotaxis protein